MRLTGGARSGGLRALAGVAALCAALLALGCRSAATGAGFTDADGRRGALRVSAFDGSRHARLAPAEGIAATGLLHPRSAVTVAAGQALYLQYRATVAEASVSVTAGDGDEIGRYRLAAGGDVPIHRQLPAPAGSLRGFRLWTDEPAGTLDVLAAGVAPARTGVALVDGVLHVGVDVRLARGTTADAGGIVDLAAHLPAPRAAPQPGRALVVRSAFTPAAPGGAGELLLSVSDGAQRRATVAVTLAAGERSVHLHESVLGFVPVTVEALSHAGGAVRFQQVGRTAAGAAPLPADLDTILDYPQKEWRSTAWEVFRWNALPQVLIFDTATYAIQEELFRRLAYYVEKAGFRGTVWTDRQLDGRYGYNAHDYDAANLARFFTEAERAGAPLNARELWLRDFLAAQRVIGPAGQGGAAGQDGAAGWQAGERGGAVLSISRESPPAQRRLLMRHEAAHGVYFVHAGYRAAIAAAWREIGEPARHAWRSYLAALGYDTAWEDLMRNEFQAYLAHNAERTLRHYFGTLAPARIRRNLPAEQQAPAWFETGAEAIREQHRSVDRALQAATGMRAGRLATVSLRR